MKIITDKRNTMKMLFLWISVIALYFVAQNYLMDRFDYLRGDSKNSNCLPYHLFIVDTYNKHPETGDLVTFKTKGLSPLFEDGHLFTKKVGATSGQEIDVSNGLIKAHNSFYGTLDLLEKLQKPASDFIRKETVPEGKYFAVGTLPRSYDSRYWGYVDQSQILGKTYALY
jgi:conjugal transfer pilin signal peptidase TrbI